ncbi:symporter small accessory protein [Methanosarcina hadiensis]
MWIAYILCFVSASGCIAYGILKWNAVLKRRS